MGFLKSLFPQGFPQSFAGGQPGGSSTAQLQSQVISPAPIQQPFQQAQPQQFQGQRQDSLLFNKASFAPNSAGGPGTGTLFGNQRALLQRRPAKTYPTFGGSGSVQNNRRY